MFYSYILLSNIQDCIPPKSLTTPVAHGDGGIQKADVMGMLGLKRAKPLK